MQTHFQVTGSHSNHINQNSVVSIITKCKEYGTCKSASARASSQTESQCKNENSEGGHQDTCEYSEGIQSFSSWDGRDTATVAGFFTRALWESSKEKATVEESWLNICSPKGMRGIPRSTGRKFSGLMKQKLSSLALRIDAMFGRHQTLHITLSLQWSMVVVTSCCGYASELRALEGF